MTIPFTFGHCRLMLPEKPLQCFLILPMGEQSIEFLHPLLTEGIALVILTGFDWNRDLSPWPAPAVFGKEEFGGNAPAFLEAICTQILPTLRKTYPPIPFMLVGYSMAGLFALWAAHQTADFSAIAAVSASFWFDGLTDYLAQHPCLAQRMYLSVGDKEKHTRNARMKTVQTAAEQLAKQYTTEGIETFFQLNPGNHFQEVDQRLLKGIRYLCSPSTQKE